MRTNTFVLLAIIGASSACATTGTRGAKLEADSRVAMTITRAPGSLGLHVLVAPRCPAADENPCPEGKPTAGLAVAAHTDRGDRELGTTSSDGSLEVPFSELDQLFRGETVPNDQRVSFLVEGRNVSELAIGDIINRQSIVDSAIKECDEALANPELTTAYSDYAQDLLGRMLDLQLLGFSDDALKDRTTRLSERIREKPDSMWSQPKKLSERAADLLASLRESGNEDAVPPEVRRELESPDADHSMDSSSFRWALDWLPTVCKVTIKGGAIVGAVAVTGAPGVALAIIDAAVGDTFSDWMIKTCCKKGSAVLGDAEAEKCAANQGG